MAPTSFRLEHIIERMLAGPGSEKSKLKALAGVILLPSETRNIWPEVMEHKWYMSERLGRDVGLRAAVADYLANVHGVRESPRLRDTLPPTLPFMRPHDR